MSNRLTESTRLLIKDTLADAAYIKNDGSPITGVFRVLLKWFPAYYALIVLNRLFALYASFHPDISYIYFLLPSLSYTVGYFLILMYYYHLCSTTRMTNVEKDYLKTYSIVPIVLCGQYMIQFPIWAYIPELYRLMYVIPFGGIIGVILSVNHFSSYFHDKKLNWIIIFHVLIIVAGFLAAYLSALPYAINMLRGCIFIRDFIVLLSNLGIFELIHFMTIYACLKNKIKEKQHEYINI